MVLMFSVYYVVYSPPGYNKNKLDSIDYLKKQVRN